MSEIKEVKKALTVREKMLQDLDEMEAFDTQVITSLKGIKEAVDTANFEHLVREEDSKKVRAHKNGTLRKVTSLVNTFRNGLIRILGEEIEDIKEDVEGDN